MQAHESRIRLWQDELDWQACDVLGLDVGDVLSKKYTCNVGDPPYLSADPGAVAFVVFYIVRYGPKLTVASRVNRPFKSWFDKNGWEQWHWIMRFLDALGLCDMGVDWDDCHLVYTAKDKPAHLTTVKAVVDNDFENLWYIGMDPDCQNCALIQYSNNGRDTGKFTAHRGAERWYGFREISAKVMAISSWYDLARFCKLPVSAGLWDVVEKASPPYHPWSKSLLSMVLCQSPQFFPRPPSRHPFSGGQGGTAGATGAYVVEVADNDDSRGYECEEPQPSCPTPSKAPPPRLSTSSSSSGAFPPDPPRL